MLQKVTVEFFGPFREYGRKLELKTAGEMTYGELLGRLGEVLGDRFVERAGKPNTTLVVNNRVVERNALPELLVHPGDRVAFALLIGGG